MAYDILIDDPVNAPALMRKAKRIGTAISPNIQDAVANAELIFVAMTCSDSPIAAEMTEVAEKLEFLGLEPLAATATGKRLEWFANLKFDEALPAPTDCTSFLPALGD